MNNAPALHLIDNEQRALDTDLAERLGFSVPVNLRKLIRRTEEELGCYGVLSTVAITSSARGGSPGSAYYLNEEQTLLHLIWAENDLDFRSLLIYEQYLDIDRILNTL